MSKKYQVDQTVWKICRVPKKHFDEQTFFFSWVQQENDAHFVSSFDNTSLSYYVLVFNKYTLLIYHQKDRFSYRG